MGRLEQLLLAGAALAAAAAAVAAETISYTHYSYDKADNRTSKTTTGAPK